MICTCNPGAPSHLCPEHGSWRYDQERDQWYAQAENFTMWLSGHVLRSEPYQGDAGDETDR